MADDEQIRQEVANAYQWILGRPADEIGLSHYAEAMASGVIDATQLRLSLLGSQEFLRPTPRLAEVDIGGGMKAVIDPEEPEFGRTIVKDRGWEGHIMGVVRTHLAPGHVFVDVGANVGVMSFHAASIVGPQGRVVAFEPHVGNATAFRRGIVANGLDNVRLFAFGLSDEHRMISLSDGSNAKVTGEASALQGAEVIQAIPGDEITLPLRRVDLIKIDVEGFELRVLRGLRRTIRKFRPKILCEFNPLCLRAHGGIDPAELADHLFALAPHGDLVEHDGSLTRVRSAKELMDLWCQRDVEVTREGVLPAGWLHFDILLDSARSRLWRRSP